MKHNILVDLTWAWTYVSAEYRLYTFDEEGNVTNAKVSTGCVLINKNEPRKFNVSGVLLCVFLQ